MTSGSHVGKKRKMKYPGPLNAPLNPNLGPDMSSLLRKHLQCISSVAAQTRVDQDSAYVKELK